MLSTAKGIPQVLVECVSWDGAPKLAQPCGRTGARRDHPGILAGVYSGPQGVTLRSKQSILMGRDSPSVAKGFEHFAAFSCFCWALHLRLAVPGAW